ncbi:MAG: sulfatase [Planctomycetaceae bacterium]|nr:sulfatase [Planctomycetaceae bacterium]
MIDSRNDSVHHIWLLMLFTFTGLGTTAFAQQPARPNILFILADDLAWADLGCYGHPWHETPHLDKLASQGMRFTDAYAPAPICSASRASFLTGKTTARLGFEFVTKQQGGTQQIDMQLPLQAPPFTLNLPLEEQTIAEQLGGLGYHTAFFGKWHLNAHHERYLGWSPTHGPAQQGFQTAIEDFGGHPYSWGKRTPEPLRQQDEFPADTMVDRVVSFIKADHPEPFFLMASQFYVHTPVKTPCEWLTDQYAETIPSDSPARERRIRYAAFVTTLDHYVGRILAALDESSLTQNTIVVFTSDNGGHPEYTTNAPFRGSKWNLYEGGIRVPFIVRWPGMVPGGATSKAPVVGYDLLPTLTTIPSDRASKTGDGVSLLGELLGYELVPQRDLIWHFPYYHPETGFAAAPDTIGTGDFVTSRTRPQSALRRGKYKLLHFYEDGRNELYDLSIDPGEQHNLATEQPKLTTDLADALAKHLKEMNARFPTQTAK